MLQLKRIIILSISAIYFNVNLAFAGLTSAPIESQNSFEVSGGRLPYQDLATLQNLEKEEKRLWTASNDFEEAIRKSGRLYPTVGLQSYLQGIMDRLYPEFIGAIKVNIVKSPILNAFAIPNGNIYVHTGLLSRFDNEAQLAAVLAHEGAHFVFRHGYYNQKSLKNASAFATITAVIGVPIIGLLGNVVATSSIFGYSRTLETEADSVGFERLVKAGYEVKEAAKVFEHLAAEAKLQDEEENFFYSTHPKLKDRVLNYTKLAETHGLPGEVNQEVFTKKVKDLRIEDLEMGLSSGRYKHIVALLTNEKVHSRYPSLMHYYLGEAYRKRNDENDDVLAIIELDKSIEENPNFAPSYRSKAMLMMGQGNNQEAIKLFTQYLDLDPDAGDKSYVMGYLEQLNKNN